jgi:hypothetical protein
LSVSPIHFISHPAAKEIFVENVAGTLHMEDGEFGDPDTEPLRERAVQ